jgi:hypothetical protein
MRSFAPCPPSLYPGDHTSDSPCGRQPVLNGKAHMDYNFTPDLLAGFALAGAGTSWGWGGGAMRSRSEPALYRGLAPPM